MSAAPILLHLGFHKTGTTSVQAALIALKKARTPHVQILLHGDLEDLPGLARRVSRGETSAEAFGAAARKVFARIAPDDPRALIVSSEDLAGSLPGRGLVRDYGAAPALAEALAGALRPLRRPLHIIYSTRAAQPWLRSLWWQHLRVTRLTATAEEFSHSYANAARFEPLLDRIAALPDVTLHRFALENSAAEPSGPVAPLLRLAGLPPDLWPAPQPPQNAQLDLGLEEIFVALNRSGLPDAYVLEQKRLIQRKAERMLRSLA